MERSGSTVYRGLVVAIAVKAQHHLQKEFWRLPEKKHTNKAVVAVARELTGFIWML